MVAIMSVLWDNLFELTNVKKPHFLPISILKNFTYDGQYLHAYNITQKTVFTPNTSNVCKQHMLYNYKSKSASLEDMFTLIETKITPIIDNINSSGYDYELTQSDMSWLITYRIMQVARGPVNFDAAMRLHTLITEKSFGSTNPQPFDLNPDDLHDITLDGIKLAVEDVIQNTDKYLKKYQMTLIYGDTATFIINDRGFCYTGQIFLLPLSPKVLLCVEPKISNGVLCVFKKYIDNSEQIKIINGLLKFHAAQFIFASDPQLLETDDYNDGSI